MLVLPDWLPALHLLLVPIPVVLFGVALFVDVVALLFRAWRWGIHAATGLYAATAATSVLAYYVGTGNGSVPPEAATTLTRHADWSTYALIALLGYALLRGAMAFLPDLPARPGLHAGVIALALGCAYPLGVSTTTGLQLSFRHGVGLPVPTTARAPTDTTRTTDAIPDSLRGVRIRETGWTWRPRTPGRWKDQMMWVEGAPPDVRAYLFEPEGSGQKGLALHLDDTAILFVGPPTLGDVEVTAELNADDFDGTVRVVHHVRGARYYDALAWQDDDVRLIRVEGSQVTVFDRHSQPMRGWQTVRVVGAGTTFRAYIEDTMVVDADENPAGPGQVGLSLEGSGVVRVRSMDVRAMEPAS